MLIALMTSLVLTSATLTAPAAQSAPQKRGAW
jgi:hypothetical protein